MPTSHAPPSRISVDGVAEVVGDVRAVVGDTWPKRFADGAAMPPPNARKQRARDRMRRHAQADAVLAAGDDVVHVRGARHDQRQRPGPERGAPARAPSAGIARAQSLRRRDVAHVHDHRMVGRPALGREDAAHGGGVAGVGAEPVDRLGRKRDELAGAQQPRRARDRRARRPARPTLMRPRRCDGSAARRRAC